MMACVSVTQRKICGKWIHRFWCILSWVVFEFLQILGMSYFFQVLKKLLRNARLNLLLFLFKQNPYARYFGSYARPLKICEVCNFGAFYWFTVWVLTDCWFRLIWNCSFCKELQLLLLLKSKIRRLHCGGFETLTERISLNFTVVCATFRGHFPCSL